MIAIGLIFLDAFWRTVIFGIIGGSILFGSMFIVQLSSVLCLAPIAAILLKRQIAILLDTAPMDKFLYHALQHVDQYIVASQIIHDRLAEIVNTDTLTPDSGLVDTLPVDNDLLPIVLQAKFCRGKGMDDELRESIRKFFSPKKRIEYVRMFENIRPNKTAEARLIAECKSSTDLKRIVPFHAMSFARVDIDTACRILDRILQFETIDEKTAKACRDSSHYMTKAIHRFINEMVYYVYDINIGPMLTPYMLTVALKKIDAAFLENLPRAMGEIDKLVSIGIVPIMERYNLGNALPHSCLKLSSSDCTDIVFGVVKNRLHTIVSNHSKRVLETYNMIMVNTFEDDNLGEATLTII